MPRPTAVTDHAITIAAGPEHVWPWLVQMGWGRAGWYTARWVDRLLFPANGPSTDQVVPELQDIEIGTFIPDGPPETECGLIVEGLEPERALVLHSTTHLPLSWRERASADWSWAFVLTPPARRRHAVPLSVPLGDQALVVHRRGLADDHPGGLHHVARHAARGQGTG